MILKKEDLSDDKKELKIVIGGDNNDDNDNSEPEPNSGDNRESTDQIKIVTMSIV